MNVTLDGGCLADLEDGTPPAAYLRSLVHLHERGRLLLRVAAIGASEQQPDGIFASSFGEFSDRIARSGLGCAEILEPIFRWGLTFDDWSLWPDPELEAMERRIHELLFRRLDFRWSDLAARRTDPGTTDLLHARWRQARCDTLCMWTHIRYGGDVFVTRNEVYWQRDNREQLIRMGAGDILTPQGALTRFGDHLFSV